MKIYFAVTGDQEPSYLPKNGLGTLLMSYHYYKNKREKVAKLVQKNDIFIDSGAFSAANAGKEVDIDDYCEFLLETKATYYAGLDVIGDAKATMSNQKYMEGKGLKPVPTFHMGENIDDLLYMAENYNQIAIGGMVFSSNIENWLDSVWKEMLIINADIKCHAFGMTNTKLMARYPWFSVDSSSFKSGKRFGRLILYNKLRNEFITLNYNDWIEKYALLTCDDEIMENTAFRYEITDVLSAKSYQKFVNNINNKEKEFSHLTNQGSLFG